MKSHSCIKFILSLFKEIVGINAYEMAVKNVSQKIEDKVNPLKKGGIKKYANDSGTLE